MSRFVAVVLIVISSLVLVSCGGGGGGGGGEQRLATISETNTINQSGGGISLSDGSVVTFDAGVVQEGTQVTVTSTAQPAPDSSQEVQALSPSIEIDLPSDLILDSANPDYGITVVFPVSDNAITVAAMVTGAVNTAALANTANGLFDVATNVVEVTVVNAGTTLDTVSTYFGKLIPNAEGNAVVTIGKGVLCLRSLGSCVVKKLVIRAKNAIECTKQSTQLYQVDFQNGEPVISTDILRNGKPPLILVHGWQELGIIGFNCNKPYSSTWQRFHEEFALAPTISDQFQVFSLGYSTSNSISVVGSDLAQILQAQFGQDPVYVVAHSMGGLVARAALVNDNAKINGLVMLATPNHGSPIASEEGVDLFGNTILYPIVDYIIGGEGVEDLAWDNFDGFYQFHDRRGNLGNPVLDDLKAKDTNYGHYVVFAGGGNNSLLGAIINSLGYDNDLIVPVASALLYNSNNVQDSQLKLQKRYEGITHLNITDDAEVLADTRAALLGFLSILPTPTPGIVEGATSVSVNSTIDASFIRPIDVFTLDTGTFQITGPDGLVAGTITYDTTTQTVIFTPAMPLAYNTHYTATITTGVKDSLGYSMESDFSWSFTTDGAGNTTPEGYLQFDEGDPVVEGDSIFVNSSQPEIFKNSLTVVNRPLIGTNPDGTTITVFTELPSDQEFAQLSFEFGYLGTSCLVLVEDNDNVFGLTTHGETTYYGTYYLTLLTDNVRQLITSGETITNTSGCSNANVSNMYINRIEFLKFNLDPVSVDAVTIDSGPVRR